MALNSRGWEENDDTPIARPLKWNRQGSTLDQIRQAVGLASREAAERGEETFDDANDFDVGDEDDYQPQSLHELRAFAAELAPEQLYEAVFKKPYNPPAPVVPGTVDSAISGGPAGNNPPVATPPITPVK